MTLTTLQQTEKIMPTPQVCEAHAVGKLMDRWSKTLHTSLVYYQSLTIFIAVCEYMLYHSSPRTIQRVRVGMRVGVDICLRNT